MRKIDETWILCGLAWLVFGMAFGMWLGATERFDFANSHAHIGLVGFVVSCLFGLIMRLFPGLRGSKMAKPQFWIYQVGAILLVAGKIRVDAGGPPDIVAFASVVVFCGAALFVWMFATGRQIEPRL